MNLYIFILFPSSRVTDIYSRSQFVDGNGHMLRVLQAAVVRLRYDVELVSATCGETASDFVSGSAVSES